MSAPTSAQPAPVDAAADVTRTFTAMASSITLRIVDPGPQAEGAADAVAALFADVERACTRFDPTSPLMVANAAPTQWTPVPSYCFDAIAEAARAHVETQGRFDPRVLTRLQQIGYDRTLAFAAGDVQVISSESPASATSWRSFASTSAIPVAQVRGRWRPQFDAEARAVLIGPEPIDLGGIGKGLAVRWAAQVLAGQGSAFLVEAGGDCYLSGPGPDGRGWRVAVEDPHGGTDPVAVLNVADLACATSSIRIRRWHVDGRPVHHLIDPRTGEPGGAGLMSVTVAGPDPAWAEVWSKSLFLEGATGIARRCEKEGLAALWVTDEGRIGTSPAMDPHVMWRADR